MTRLFSLVALFTLFAILAVSCRAEEILHVDFAYYNPISLVVKQQHLIENAVGPSVQVQWLQSAGSNKALEYLRAGALDFGSTAGSAALLGRANGIPLKIVAVYGRPEWVALVTRSGSPIHKVADLLPLYALCEELDVPAFLMSGPTTPDLHDNDPLAVDAVARLFPRLPIVCCHGFYPAIDGMLAVAFRHENVIVSPDMYVFAPGGSRYVDAARGFLRHQLVFGSSFPFRPMAQGVRDFRAFELDNNTRVLALGGTAARLLRRTSSQPDIHPTEACA